LLTLLFFVAVFFISFNGEIARTYDTDSMPTYKGLFINSEYPFSSVDDIGANAENFVIVDQYYDTVSCEYLTTFYRYDHYGYLITSWSDDNTIGEIGGIDLTEDGNVVVGDERSMSLIIFSPNGSTRIDRSINVPDLGLNEYLDGIAVSLGGDIYVGVEYGIGGDVYNKVMKYSRNGDYITSWGVTGTGVGEFVRIVRLSTDTLGYVYVLDENEKVVKFTPDGEYVMEFDTGILPAVGEKTYDIAVDLDGNILIAYEQYVYIYDSTGVYVDRVDISADAEVSGEVNTLSIDVSIDGKIFIGDMNNPGVYQYDDTYYVRNRWLARKSWEAGIIPSYGSDGDMVMDSQGNLYFSNNLDSITVYNDEGILIDAIAMFATGGMDFDSEGNLYYVDSGNYVRVFDTNRNPIDTWGIQGLGMDIEYAEKIAISPTGYIYLVDPWGCYYKVDSSHNVLFTRCGGEIDDHENLHTYISDIVFDSEGNYYMIFNENDESHISSFTSEDVFIESWGSQGTLDYQFDYVPSMTIDQNDTLIVADSAVGCIKMFTTDGQYINKICDYEGEPFVDIMYIMYHEGIIYVADASTREIYMYEFDVNPPEIDINATLKSSTSPITDTTISVVDDNSIIADDVLVDNASTAEFTDFDCQQVDSKTVTCSIEITSSGNLIINAIDSEGNLGNEQEDGYIIDYPPVPVVLSGVNGVTGFADGATLTFVVDTRSPVITGSTDPDTTVFFLAGSNRYQATPDINGNFTLTIDNPRLPQGSTVTMQYWARDAIRSLSTVKNINLTVSLPTSDTTSEEPIYQYLYLPKGAQRPSGTTPVALTPVVDDSSVEEIEIPTIITEEENIAIPTRRYPGNQAENIGTRWITPEQAEDVALWSAGSAVVAFTVAMILGESNPVAYIFRFVTYAFGWLKVRKKHNSFIVVYDAVSKEPISLAIIRFMRVGAGLVDTQVTNEYGIVDVALPEGEYNILVSARDYKYPSSVITVSNDDTYENIYRGGKLFAKEGVPINISIPLDPINSDDKSYNLAKFRSVLANMVEVLQYLLLVVGFIFAGIAYMGSSTTVNLIVLALYFVIILINIYITIKGNRNYGKVKDTYGNAISGMTLSLVERKYDRVSAVRVTDKNGKYRFVVPPANYSLVSNDPKYRINGNIDISKDKDSASSLIINKNILVERISK